MKFLNKYRPETRKQNKERMKDKAEREKNGEAVECEKIQVLKHGINHVAALIDAKKAKLVIIASDIEPSEIVMWLPGFCRKKGVPYTIVDNKLRLGTLVNKKAAPVVALTDIKTEDKDAFYILVSDIRKSTVEDNEAARKSHMRRGLYDLPLAAGLFSKYL
ncbi:50S ribosomal protein L30e-like protein [Gamsiella multidivaricata]|uniref:50S ribosomal protein L30e-like protein n=1 Tax=Gamsiella multidivaricata TaxID=101098 RepID=UPI00221F2D60|nr:50S ribosomal protein L30e-like protein [Gamsiella multidivaricata]KAI7815959.1 50S ribosomal protein L30e-like protein [Gamsiella multidivaricata]